MTTRNHFKLLSRVQLLPERLDTLYHFTLASDDNVIMQIGFASCFTVSVIVGTEKSPVFQTLSDQDFLRYFRTYIHILTKSILTSS